MNNQYIPADVYNNLILLADYRNIILDAEPLTRDNVINKLNHHEYIQITGKRDGDNPRGEAVVYMILITPGSKYSTRLIDFKKLINGIPRSQKPMEIIIVSDRDLTTYIKKEIVSFKINNPNIWIEHHNYEIFMIEIPKHISVPKHEIADPTEVAKYCHKYCILPVNFQKILQSDPIAVWIGLRPGMVVKIYRVSENTGESIVYRYCIKG